jgi:hypothetical protein
MRRVGCGGRIRWRRRGLGVLMGCGEWGGWPLVGGIGGGAVGGALAVWVERGGLVRLGVWRRGGGVSGLVLGCGRGGGVTWWWAGVRGSGCGFRRLGRWCDGGVGQVLHGGARCVAGWLWRESAVRWPLGRAAGRGTQGGAGTGGWLGMTECRRVVSGWGHAAGVEGWFGRGGGVVCEWVGRGGESRGWLARPRSGSVPKP